LDTRGDFFRIEISRDRYERVRAGNLAVLDQHEKEGTRTIAYDPALRQAVVIMTWVDND